MSMMMPFLLEVILLAVTLGSKVHIDAIGEGDKKKLTTKREIHHSVTIKHIPEIQCKINMVQQIPPIFMEKNILFNI